MSNTAFQIDIPPIIREYTVDSVWTKPTSNRFKGIWIQLLGGGGGGGAGRGSVTTKHGGGGGGGGAFVTAWFSAPDLGATMSCSIGLGGAGGASNDTPGTEGGDTSFIDNGTQIARARGGVGGPCQTSTPWQARSNGEYCFPRSAPTSWTGGASSLSTYTATPRPGSDGFNQCGAPGGGGAGGLNNSISSQAGYAGGGIYTTTFPSTWTYTAGPAGGASTGADGGDGADNVVLLKFLNRYTASIGIGTGGGGAGANNGASNKRGGHGGLYGAGGGGGAAAVSSGNVGAGGDGAKGCIVILEVYN